MTLEEAQKNIEKLTVALVRAASEAFTLEVVHRGLEATITGPNKPFKTKQDWIDQRIDEWLSKPAIVAAKQPVFGPGMLVNVVVNKQIRRGTIHGESEDKKCWLVEVQDTASGDKPGPQPVEKEKCFTI